MSPRDDLLAESAEQEYVGSRDLTRWPSAAGRALLRVFARAAHGIGADRVLALTLVAGLVLLGLLTAAAAAVYDAVTEDEGVAGLDLPVLRAMMRARTPDADRWITWYTNLGSGPGLLVIATVGAGGMAIAWRQWSPIVLTVVTAIGASTMVGVGKGIVGRSRPPLIDAVPPYEHSFSFPSGHSLNSMAIAGILAYCLVRKVHTRLLRVVVVVVALLFAVLIGLSRVYLGHHWLTDVLCAWALALAWLTVVIVAHRLFLTVRRRRLDKVGP